MVCLNVPRCCTVVSPKVPSHPHWSLVEASERNPWFWSQEISHDWGNDLTDISVPASKLWKPHSPFDLRQVITQPNLVSDFSHENWKFVSLGIFFWLPDCKTFRPLGRPSAASPLWLPAPKRRPLSHSCAVMLKRQWWVPQWLLPDSTFCLWVLCKTTTVNYKGLVLVEWNETFGILCTLE